MQVGTGRSSSPYVSSNIELRFLQASVTSGILQVLARILHSANSNKYKGPQWVGFFFPFGQHTVRLLSFVTICVQEFRLIFGVAIVCFSVAVINTGQKQLQKVLFSSHFHVTVH